MSRQPAPRNIQNYSRLHSEAWRNYISKISPITSPKYIWRMIRNIKGFNSKKKSLLLKYDNLFHDLQERSEILVEYFQSIMTSVPNDYNVEDKRFIGRISLAFLEEDKNQILSLINKMKIPC